MSPALFLAGMALLCVVACAAAVRAWRAVETRPLRPLEAVVARLAVVAVMALPLMASAGGGALPGPRAASVGLPTTGGTMTGQVVMCGVATDFSTCANEPMTLGPSGTGNLVVNGGGAAPSIDVVTTATNNTAEIFQRWGLSDETNTKCQLSNGSATNSSVNPTLACHSDEGSGWNAMTIMGSVAAAADTGTAAAIRMYTARGTAPGTPSAALTTIPLWELYNYTTQVISTSAVGRFAALLWGTITNCSDGAGAAACSAAPAGSVVIDAAATTVVVSTTAVTANSQIFIQEDSSLGTKLSATCNTTTGRDYTVSARTAGTSFTITSSAAPVTNPACLSYFIVN